MVQGYLITFFTQKSRKHEGIPVADWIVEKAKKMGVHGATLFTGNEGFGRDGRFHSGNYFDLEDPPQLVTMALTVEECDTLMSCLKSADISVFYTKSKAELGCTSEA